MTPWALTRPSQLRLPPPLSLNSPEYVADFYEVKAMGIFSGSARTPDQSELALFWALNTPLAWNRIAAQLAAARGLESDRECTPICGAQCKSRGRDNRVLGYQIPLRFLAAGHGDPNGLTPADADPTWQPWLDTLTGTPAHPEYPSAHSTYSGSAAFILSAQFGENTAFSLTSEIRPGTRSFASFSDAIAEIVDARVFGGIHFRTSCLRGNTLGRAVADYVSRHAMRPRGDDPDDEKRLAFLRSSIRRG